MLAINGAIDFVRHWLPRLWQGLVKASVAIWASFAALLKSPAAWLACGVLFVAGFSAGHAERSIALRKVKAEVATLTLSLNATRTRERALAVDLVNARREASEAKAELAAAMERLKPKPQPAAKPAPAKRIPTKG